MRGHTLHLDIFTYLYTYIHTPTHFLLQLTTMQPQDITTYLQAEQTLLTNTDIRSLRQPLGMKYNYNIHY